MNYCKECETCKGCLTGKKCLFDNPGGVGAGIGAMSGQKQPLTPHKHAAVIKAWADGAELEVSPKGLNRWRACTTPTWGCDYTDFRIKPEPKPDVVELKTVAPGVHIIIGEKANLKLTFDGETGALKSAEVLK